MNGVRVCYNGGTGAAFEVAEFGEHLVSVGCVIVGCVGSCSRVFAWQVLRGDDNDLDDPAFDPVAYINKKFPTEESLSGVDAFLVTSKDTLDRLDDDILQSVSERVCPCVCLCAHTCPTPSPFCCVVHKYSPGVWFVYLGTDLAWSGAAVLCTNRCKSKQCTGRELVKI